MKKISKNLFLLGFQFSFFQVIAFRESFLFFLGSELTAGFFFFYWLIGQSLGIWAGKKFSKYLPLIVAEFFLILGFIFFYRETLFLQKGRVLGEVFSVDTTIVYLAVLILPVTFLGGVVFSLYSLQLRKLSHSVATDILGGILAGFFITYLLTYSSISKLGIYLWVFFLGIVRIVDLSLSSSQKVYKGVNLLLTLLLVFLVPQFFLRWERENYLSKSKLFDKLLVRKDTPYGEVELWCKGESYYCFYNHNLTYVYPAVEVAEENVHFALLPLKKIERVLLIGGVLDGNISEVQKYKPHSIEAVELDPYFFKLIDRYYPLNYKKIIASKNVNLNFTDGRNYLKDSLQKYTAILLTVSMPLSVLQNRFLTLDFFKIVRRHLSSGGVFAFSLEGGEDFLQQEHILFLKNIFNTLCEVFPQVYVIPGQKVIFLAKNGGGNIDVSYEGYQKYLIYWQEKGVETKYVNSYYLVDRLSEWKRDWFQRTLKSLYSREINLDYHPISYYYSVVYFLNKFGETKFASFLKHLERYKNWYYGLLLFGWFIGVTLGNKINKKYFLFSFYNGFWTMLAYLILMYMFQLHIGVIYVEVGMFSSFFFLGMYFSLKKGGFLPFRFVFIFVEGLLLFLLLVIFLWQPNSLLFYLLSFAFGFAGGMFLLFLQEEFIDKKEYLYSGEMLGSSLSAILWSSIFLPLYGIKPSIIFLIYMPICFLVEKILKKV